MIGVEGSGDRNESHGLWTTESAGPALPATRPSRAPTALSALSLPAGTTFTSAPLPAGTTFTSAPLPAGTTFSCSSARRTFPFARPLGHGDTESHHHNPGGQRGQPVSFLHDSVL